MGLTERDLDDVKDRVRNLTTFIIINPCSMNDFLGRQMVAMESS